MTTEVYDYEALGARIGRLVREKQDAYGDSFGKAGEVMALLYPEGIAPEQYGDALTLVRIIDKLFRIATDRDALGESPYQDIAGYGLLGTARVERERAADRITDPEVPEFALEDRADVDALLERGEELLRVRESYVRDGNSLASPEHLEKAARLLGFDAASEILDTD